MVSVLRFALAASVASAMTVFAAPGHVRASGSLPAQVQTKILNVIAHPDRLADQCLSVAKLSELVSAYPNLTNDIVDFASQKLIRRPDHPELNCACPEELAVATVRAAPELARTTRRILEGRYPECATEVDTAMQDTLAALAPGAGTDGQSRPPKYPGMLLTEETCQDASAPGCGAFEPTNTANANPDQDNSATSPRENQNQANAQASSIAPGAANQGHTPSESAGATDSGQRPSTATGIPGSGQPATKPLKTPASATLPPAVLQQVTELMEQGGGGGKQCFPVSKMSELLATHPDLALQIIDFAGVQSSSRSSLSDDHCICPTNLATAVVSAVPELANRTKHILEDRYPECAPEVETAMAETLATFAPGAGVGSQSRPVNYPGNQSTNEICRDTSSPGCGFIKPNDTTSASPDQRSSADSPVGDPSQAGAQDTPIALIPIKPGQSAPDSGGATYPGQTPSANAGGPGSGQSATNPPKTPAGNALPLEVVRQVTELTEQGGVSGRQCFAVPKLVELLAAYPHLALQIIEYAGVQLTSHSSLSDDHCICPVDLATAAVSAVPDLANRTRLVLEDLYPECDPDVEVAMEETLAALAPGAGTRGPLYNPDFPRPKDTDEWCRDTSSCSPLEESPQDSASPSSLP